MKNFKIKIIGIIAIFIFAGLNSSFAAPDPPPELPDIFPAPSDEQHLYAMGGRGVEDEGYIARLGTEGMLEDLNDFITLEEGWIDSTNGSAVDTTTGLVYVVVRDEGFVRLVKFSMNDGVTEIVGDLEDKFAAIAFDELGVLYGLTGDGADTPASFYRINKETAETELLASYEENEDGEALAFNSDDRMFYRATGDDMYKIDKNNPTSPIVVFEDNENLSDNVQALVHVQGNQFYLIVEWAYLVDMEDVNTGEFDFEENVYEMDTEYKGLFFWNLALSLEDTAPIKNSNTAAVDTDLSLQFNSNAVVAGSGNIEIYKYNDNSLIETIDVTSDNVTGWNTNSLDIDLSQTLENDAKYYVLIDNTAIVNFDGIDNKDDWTFAVRPEGNDFDFDDNFEDDDFIDGDETTAQKGIDGSYSLVENSGVWTNADRSTEGKEDIQNNTENAGNDPKIVLDDNNNQMVVWAEDGVIMFTRWNGDEWVTMDNSMGKEDISTSINMCPGGECREATHPQIFIDNDGNSVVAWIGIDGEGDTSIFVRKWDGDNWVTMSDLDDADKLFDDRLPSWGAEFHMISSSLGNPMIVSVMDDWGGEMQKLFYAEWTGSEWSGKWDIGDEYDWLEFPNFATYPQIARDSNNTPMIIWVEAGSRRGVYFTYWNGNDWSNMNDLEDYDVISSDETEVSAKIEINSSDNPVIAYSYAGEISGIGVNRWTGSNWENKHLAQNAVEIIDLTLSSEGTPYVTWLAESDAEGGEGESEMQIKLAKAVGESWRSMDDMSNYDIVEGMGSGMGIDYMEMVLTSNDDPMIVWSMQTMGSTHFKMWNGGNWTAGNGASSNSDSLSGDVLTNNVDMVINSDNEPSVVWSEEGSSSDNIYFVVLPTEVTSPSVVQSITINGSIKDIIKATLTANEELEGESYIEYFLSNDGGVTWIEVNLGEEVTFDEKGDDLMWRAVLYKGSVPILNGVNVDYSVEAIDPPTPDNPECGSNAGEYDADDTEFIGNFCEVGTFDSEPLFPSQGENVSWNCIEESNTVSCNASRKEETPDPADPIDPVDPEEPEDSDTKECTTDNIKEVTKDSVTLRVSVDDSYADEKTKFKVEVENLYLNEKETIKLTDKPSGNGKATLLIDNLEEDTKYRFKVEYEEEGEYQYCPHSKTVTTEQIFVGPSLPGESVDEEVPEDNSIEEEDINNDEQDDKKSEKDIVSPVSKSDVPPIQGGASTVSQTNQEDSADSSFVTNIINKMDRSVEENSGKYQAVAVLGTMTGTLIAAASTAIPLFATMPLVAKDIFIMPFMGILMRRRNEQNWGTVFEQTTKQPISGVKLTLVDEQGNEIETTYSDHDGRFGFLTQDGTYVIDSEKSKYDNNYEHDNDSLYGVVYTGNTITIEENKVLITNIAMNAINVNWSEYADKKAKSYKSTFSLIKKWNFIILFYVGFLATAIIAIFQPSMLNVTFLIIYILLFIYDNFIKSRKYGTVETQDKNPIPFSVVSLHDKQTNQKESFAVTDAIGRYYLLAENGNYTMKVKGQPISGEPFERQGDVHVSDGLVRKDLKI